MEVFESGLHIGGEGTSNFLHTHGPCSVGQLSTTFGAQTEMKTWLEDSLSLQTNDTKTRNRQVPDLSVSGLCKVSWEAGYRL